MKHMTEHPEPTEPVGPAYVSPPPAAYAPPHPYGAAAATSTQAPKRSIFAIISMALGLLALLTVAVGFFFAAALGTVLAGVAAFFTVLFALAAIVLGIVALVRRAANKAPAITGIISAVVAVFTTVALVGYLTMIALSPGWAGGWDGNALGGGGDSEAHGSEQVPSEPGAPHKFSPLSFSGEWPAGYADGGLTFDETLTPIASKPLTSGEVPLAPAMNRDSGPADILLFVDYRCPVCMFFEQTNAPAIEEALTTGQATLQVRALTFLDRASAGSAYSSRAAGAVACLAQDQPDAVWPVHSALLSADVQPAENNAGLDDAALIKVFEQAAGPISPAVKSCIEDRTFVPFAQAFTDWSFENPVPNALDPALSVQGTPMAIVNGVPYQGSVSDPQEFQAFLAEQGITVK